MKRKLNEGVSNVDTVKINITSMKRDFPDVNYNDIRDNLTDMGARVDGEVADGNTYMIIAGIPANKAYQTVADVVNDYTDDDIDDVDVMEYAENADSVNALEEPEDVDMSDDDLEQFLEGLTIDMPEDNECCGKGCDDNECCGKDCECDGSDVSLDTCLDMLMTEDVDDAPVAGIDYPAYDDVDTAPVSGVDYPAYDDVDTAADGENVDAIDRLVSDIADNIDENDDADDDTTIYDDELEANECLESLHRRALRRAIVEKKRSCCPGKKGKLIALTEALKAADPKKQDALKASEGNVIRTIEDIVNALKGNYITTDTAKDALAKLKKEQKAMAKIAKNDKGDTFKITDVKNGENSVSKTLNRMKKAVKDEKTADQIDKFQKELKENVLAALKANKSYLYENVRVNGKMLKDYTIKQLRGLLAEANNDKDALVEKICASLNESVSTDLKAKISKKAKLISILEEELSYRTTRIKCLRRLNEEDAEIKDSSDSSDVKESAKVNEDDDNAQASGGDFTDDDLANMFGAPQGEEGKDDAAGSDAEDGDADDTENEEVDLARVVITLKDREAADDLKQSCVDAGIPEEAMEIQEGNDEEESSDAESSDAEAEDNNESVRYSNISRLFEDDDENADASDNADAESSDADADAADEGNVKFILTDTDYISQLSGVLDDVYGISREQLEDMIGGEIVDETNDEGSSDAEGDAEGGDDQEEDDIDIDDLFKNM